MTLKTKISKLVDDYAELYPEELAEFLEYMEGVRDEQWDDAASIETGEHVQRKLFEMPETLDHMITTQLSDEELAEWKTKEMGRWFAKKFPGFTAARIV